MDELTQAPRNRLPAGEAADRPEQWRAASIADDPVRPLDLFLLIIWFSLLTRLLEAGLALAHRSLFDRISLESVRTNRHFIWMIPTADVLLFGVAGLLSRGWAGEEHYDRVQDPGETQNRISAGSVPESVELYRELFDRLPDL